MIDKKALDNLLESTEMFEKLAKETAKGDYIFPSDHPKVNDSSNHFPINTEGRARNALARANQFSSAPKWYRGTLDAFVNSVARAVHKKYKGIEVTEKSKKPGKG